MAKTFKNVEIERTGDKIILPEEMTYAQGREWLMRQEEAEEKKVAIYDAIDCFPLDGVVCLMRALKEAYGFAALADTPGFFGKDPPMLVQVPCADGKFETAPLGRIQPLTWEGGFIQTVVGREAKLALQGEIKRKHEGQVKRIITLTREILRKQSIYKGQAVRLDLEFMVNEDRGFHPINDAPQFMDISNVRPEMLILNPETEFDMATNIWLLIERTKACESNRIPLKHGCLLQGKFGTGKTMAANVTAQKCVTNGWSFIYLKSCRHLAPALRLAELYAPAVVFTEDIDQVVQGNRDEDINEILNTLDGVDTKGKPIITVLTTNNPQLLTPAMMRAGRIDTVITMAEPDGPTAGRFVRLYAKDSKGESLLVKDIDLAPVGEAMKGFVPAFIAEAVQKAKRFAIYREGEDIIGRVTSDDLVKAGMALRHHHALALGTRTETKEEIIAKSWENLSDVFNGDEPTHRFVTNGGHHA